MIIVLEQTEIVRAQLLYHLTAHQGVQIHGDLGGHVSMVFKLDFVAHLAKIRKSKLVPRQRLYHPQRLLLLQLVQFHYLRHNN
jgi:hypothetical protein